MAIISPSISLITLNINGLNSIIKRYTVAEWVEKKSKIQQFPGSLVVRAQVQSLVRKLISHKPPKPKKKKGKIQLIPSARVSLRLKDVYGMKVKVLQKDSMLFGVQSACLGPFKHKEPVWRSIQFLSLGQQHSFLAAQVSIGKMCSQQDLNLCKETPMGFQSIALTSQPWLLRHSHLTMC